MNNSNVFPFLWVRDEPIDKVYREIDAIKNLTDGFIIESRPRRGEISDFGTEKWFIRIGKVLAYANNLNMRVWVLDDKSFPTGFANGAILNKYPELKAKQLKADIVDFYSDGDPCFLRASISENESLLAAFLLKGGKTLKLQGGEHGVFSVKVKKGAYRAVFLIVTENCFERAGYIDMLNGESTDVLLKEIYEPYYAHFKNYFGNTLVGFFSDEPRFASGVNPYYMKAVDMYSYKVGNTVCAFPFSQEVAQKLSAQGFLTEDFISLFLPFKDYACFRVAYMNAITDLYAANFTQKLARWCLGRGVLYSGHIIEDAGVHFNVGCGAGHYFKAMRDAAYAGVDVVLHQLKPFVKFNSVAPIDGGFTDYKFYNFTLAHLASSVFCQNNNVKGAIVELFGAYGWGESIKTMLYLVNNFAVSGVGNFIPHAFSMNYMDTDCPPYFYAEGKNPAYVGYKSLFDYMNRIGGIANNGYRAKVVVYYNAESVWSGKNYTSIDDIAQILSENQIEFDFIDYDNLFAAEKSENNIKTGNAEYSLLIIPDGYLSAKTSKLLGNVKAPKILVNKSGLKVLAERVKTKINIPYRFERPCKNLRAKMFNNGDILLFNAGDKVIKNAVFYGGKIFVYDILGKKLLGKFSDKATFSLGAGETVLISKTKKMGYSEALKGNFVRKITDFSVSVKSVDGEFIKVNLAKNSLYNGNFSGFLKYEFTNDFLEGEYLYVDFYGEFLHVEVDGVKAEFLTSPAVIETGAGVNNVSLYVCNTLAGKVKDFLSLYDKIPSCGVKNIKIFHKG